MPLPRIFVPRTLPYGFKLAVLRRKHGAPRLCVHRQPQQLLALWFGKAARHHAACGKQGRGGGGMHGEGSAFSVRHVRGWFVGGRSTPIAAAHPTSTPCSCDAVQPHPSALLDVHHLPGQAAPRDGGMWAVRHLAVAPALHGTESAAVFLYYEWRGRLRCSGCVGALCAVVSPPVVSRASDRVCRGKFRSKRRLSSKTRELGAVPRLSAF